MVFSYRTCLSTPFLVLAGRSSIYASLAIHGSCAICDWDESAAYWRVVREFTGGLLRLLPSVWAWAHRYYSKLVIRVITREGFAPPFSTGEGGNLGDSFAALHYQAPSHVLTLSQEINWSLSLPLRLPGHHVSLLATVLVYSDDRRFFAPTLRQVVSQDDACRDASRRACRVIYPDKLEYLLARLLRHRVVLQRSPVPDTEMYTSTALRELAGIPLLPEVPLHCSTTKSLRALRSVHKATERGPAAFALRLRSLHTFGLAVLDYAASGVLFSPADLRPHQRVNDNTHQAAFRLPPWVHRLLLRLPLA